jgi:hypothetical protein
MNHLWGGLSTDKFIQTHTSWPIGPNAADAPRACHRWVGLGQLDGLLPELLEVTLELVGSGQVAVALPELNQSLALVGGQSAGPPQPEVGLKSAWARWPRRGVSRSSLAGNG